MALELPQPLKPILGSAAWSNLAASLGLFAVIAFLGGLGTLLEQGGPPEFYVEKYPEFSNIILFLGLDHIYTAPFFVGLLIWLGASLVTCTGTTQLPLAKRAQRLTFSAADAIKRRGQFLIKVGDSQGTTQDSVEAATTSSVQRLKRLRRVLERRGFSVRLDDEACPGRLAASRGLLGKFAPMVVHLSLLLCLLGGAAAILVGAAGEVMIGDGGLADIGEVLERGRRSKGPLYDWLNPSKPFFDNTKVKVEDFRIEYEKDGTIDQFYSKLAVEDSKTKRRLYSDEIYVNKPLRFGGATLYQANWGLDRLQLYLNGKPIVVPLKQLADSDPRTWAAFLPEELVKAKDPSAVKKLSSVETGVVLVVENMRNVQVYGADKSLAGVLRSPTAPVDPKMTGMPIQFGEVIQVDGSELRLDRIVGSTGLIVKSDPGVPLVYLGFALLMPAVLLSVQPFTEVWAAIGEDDPRQVVIGGRANRNKPAFESEMKALVLSGVL